MKSINPIHFGILLLFFIACKKERADFRTENLNIEQLENPEQILGMSISDLKNMYNDAQISEEPMFKYGIDSESNGVLIVKHGKELFFAWSLQGINQIHGVTVLSKLMVFEDGVHVGMDLESFLNKHPKTIAKIDMIQEDYEYLISPEISYIPEFMSTDSTRIAKYDYNQPEPEFTEFKDLEAKIDRITLTSN